jgi:hypothetical protein
VLSVVNSAAGTYYVLDQSQEGTPHFLLLIEEPSLAVPPIPPYLFRHNTLFLSLTPDAFGGAICLVSPRGHACLSSTTSPVDSAPTMESRENGMRIEVRDREDKIQAAINRSIANVEKLDAKLDERQDLFEDLQVDVAETVIDTSHLQEEQARLDVSNESLAQRCDPMQRDLQTFKEATESKLKELESKNQKLESDKRKLESKKKKLKSKNTKLRSKNKKLEHGSAFHPLKLDDQVQQQDSELGHEAHDHQGDSIDSRIGHNYDTYGFDHRASDDEVMDDVEYENEHRPDTKINHRSHEPGQGPRYSQLSNQVQQQNFQENHRAHDYYEEVQDSEDEIAARNVRHRSDVEYNKENNFGSPTSLVEVDVTEFDHTNHDINSVVDKQVDDEEPETTDFGHGINDLASDADMDDDFAQIPNEDVDADVHYDDEETEDAVIVECKLDARGRIVTNVVGQEAALKKLNVRWAPIRRTLRDKDANWLSADTAKTSKKCLQSTVMRRPHHWTINKPAKFTCRACANNQVPCFGVLDGRLVALPLPPEVVAATSTILGLVVESRSSISKDPQFRSRVWAD